MTLRNTGDPSKNTEVTLGCSWVILGTMAVGIIRTSVSLTLMFCAQKHTRLANFFACGCYPRTSSGQLSGVVCFQRRPRLLTLGSTLASVALVPMVSRHHVFVATCMCIVRALYARWYDSAPSLACAPTWILAFHDMSVLHNIPHFNASFL